jgi:hypothetical protein
MPKKKDELGYHLELMMIRHEKLRWSNAIIDYVLKENLKEFGWSIEPPASRKERTRDLFETV